MMQKCRLSGQVLNRTVGIVELLACGLAPVSDEFGAFRRLPLRRQTAAGKAGPPQLPVGRFPFGQMGNTEG